MPLIGSADPGYGTPVTSSPDGYLTATPWGQVGGVKLAVDFRTIPSGAPDRVTVYRTTSDGTTVAVLGLDGYPSPGAYTIGIDNTAVLGTTVLYQAVAASSTTGATWTSGLIAVPIPAAQPRGAWIKSTVYPGLSVLGIVTDWPDWQYARPQGVQYANQARYPVVVNGARRAGTGTVRLGTLDAAGKQAVETLLNSAGTLLLQAEALHGAMRPDVFVEAGQLQMSAPVKGAAWRAWQFDVIQVDRPRSAGSRVTLPGHSFADLKARYGPLSNYPKPLIQLLSS